MYAGCVKAFSEGRTETEDGMQVRIDVELMQAIPALSVDYAVMEHSKRIKVIPCDLGWSDLGSYDALFDEFNTGNSESSNVILREGITPSSSTESIEPLMVDSSGNLVVTSTRQIAMVGLDDVLVVDTPDALLLAKKGQSQQVSTIAKSLKSTGSSLMKTHTTTYRPWGCFEKFA